MNLQKRNNVIDKLLKGKIMDNLENPINAVQNALISAKNALLQHENNQTEIKFKDKRIYISVPITNNPNHRADAQAAEDMLISLGHRPVNPVKLGDAMRIKLPQSSEFDYLMNDFRLLIVCDGIYLYPGWEQSKGCVAELAVAEFIKARINPEFILRGVKSDG
jgi:hypothetical protein